MTPLEAMIDELAVADVHAGFPTERQALAVRMLQVGIEPADVALLAEHCRATVDGAAAAARVLVSLLIDDRKRDARLVDLREIAQRKAIRARQDEEGEVNGADRLCGAAAEPVETWDHDRMCRAAWCRVHGDHRSPAEVARELRVSEITLGVMLDRGRVLSQSPLVDQKAKVPTPDAVEKAERAGQDRTQEFRRRMDGDRRAARAKATGIERLWDPKRMREAEARILAGVRKDGVVDLAEVLRDPMLRGALATLEADGQITRDGAPDARQRQPYLVAKNEQERAHFRRLIGTQTQRRREEAQG